MRRVLASLALAATAAAVVWWGGATPAEPRCERCNVLLVTFDALRADHLGFAGYPRPTSPHLDAFAARSRVFERNLSQAASTIASVPSLMTGKFPHLDRLLDDGVLRPGERTLAEILAAAGWETRAIIANEWARCRWGTCQGFETVDADFGTLAPAMRTAERALPQLERTGERPLFVWVHLLQPHGPYAPPERVFASMFGGPIPDLTFFSPAVAGATWYDQLAQLTAHYVARGEQPQIVGFGGGRHRRLAPTVIRQVVAMYDGNVAEGDAAFGRLLAHLHALGEAPRTVVIVAADHAESLGEGGLIGHNLLWYRTLHTPLVVHVPGAGASRSRRLVMNVDVLPTVLDVLGLPQPEQLRGRSVFAERPHDVQYAESSSAMTIVRGDLRLALPRTRQALMRPSLYDVRSDPLEHTNLLNDRPTDAAALAKTLEALQATTLARDPTAPDTDVERKLRDLGYIE
jgi:arylsulfatase A-like enzyme